LKGKASRYSWPAIFTLHANNAVVQISAIEIAIDYLLDIGPPEAVLPGEMLVIDPDKGFKIVLYAAVKIGRLRVPWIMPRREPHFKFQLKMV